MNHPSDKAVLAINQAVRNLRYLFADEYEFTWYEADDRQQFEVSVSLFRYYPADDQRPDEMGMMQVQRFPIEYARAETMQADELSGDLFQRISSDEMLGFGTWED